MLAKVRAICTTPTREDGLVQGNLKIAEDRILSYLLVLGDPAREGSSSTAAAEGEAGDDGGGSVWTGPWETHWVSAEFSHLLSLLEMRWFKRGVVCIIRVTPLPPKLLCRFLFSLCFHCNNSVTPLFSYPLSSTVSSREPAA